MARRLFHSYGSDLICYKFNNKIYHNTSEAIYCNGVPIIAGAIQEFSICHIYEKNILLLASFGEIQMYDLDRVQPIGEKYTFSNSVTGCVNRHFYIYDGTSCTKYAIKPNFTIGIAAIAVLPADYRISDYIENYILAFDGRDSIILYDEHLRFQYQLKASSFIKSLVVIEGLIMFIAAGADHYTLVNTRGMLIRQHTNADFAVC